MQKSLLLFLFLLPFAAIAQQDKHPRTEVVQTIQRLFDGMRAGDSAMVSSVFDPQARMLTTWYDAENKPQLRKGALSSFLKAVGTPHEAVWDERIWSYDVQIDHSLASVWTPYTFFRGDTFSHCGVNTFQLYRSEKGWKIINITDTRRQEGCQMTPTDTQQTLDQLISQWHQAATDADEDTYFGLMTAGSVFIGTDASERWSKTEFMQAVESAFQRDTAWDFKTIYRHITVAEDQRSAWWDEQLDTWMGTCMGSGVLEKTEQGWKIAHYQLSIAVPNDKIEAFQQLLKE